MDRQKRSNSCLPFNLKWRFKRTHQRSDRRSTGIGCVPINTLRQICLDPGTDNNSHRQDNRRGLTTEGEFISRAEHQWRAAFFETVFHSDFPRTSAKALTMDQHTESNKRSGSAQMQTVEPPSSTSSTGSRNFALHHFELIREIGRGGMGRILEVKLKPRYQSRWRDLPKTLALKMIRVTTRLRAIVQNEIFAHKLMNRCPHVVQFFGDFVHGEFHCIVMERLEGPTLSSAIRDRGHLSELQALIVMKTVLEVIMNMHQNQIVHLDINPKNIVFRQNWTSATGPPPQACIIDFGLATQFNQILTTRGTPGYTAPEVIVGSTFVAHPSIDMFSAGSVLYEMLKGHSPFRSLTLELQLHMIRCSPLHVSGMSELTNASLEIKAIIASCLGLEPGKRISAAAALKDIEFRLWCMDWPKNDEGNE